TGYDPLLDDEPELARTMAASVKQRIAFGERAGQHVRRIGSGFGYEGEGLRPAPTQSRQRPELTGPRCANVCFCEAEDVNGFSLHANTQVPAHRRERQSRCAPASPPPRAARVARMPPRHGALMGACA